MPFDSPFPFGPFLIEADGRLTPASEEVRPSFAFRWRGRVMRADMIASGRVVLRVVVGRVPSTASDRVTARRQSFTLLRALSMNVPEGWRMSLLPDHRAVLEAGVDLPDPLTAASLLTAITAFLLRLGPYLDLVDESGMPAQAA